MAILNILTYPDSRLKTVSVPVTAFDDKLRALMVDLEETMRAGPGGVGIAAPQVGHFVQVVIVDVSSKPKITHHGHLVLVNPEISDWEGFEIGREGCMSVPDYTGNVIRATKIHLVAQDENGQQHEYDMTGYEARAVQHEIDHLDGKLFLDRVANIKTDIFRRQR
jgi:peptide deformylase